VYIPRLTLETVEETPCIFQDLF